MPRSGQDQEQINNKAHKQYIVRATGDGTRTEFPIGKRLTRLDDLMVFVAGVLLAPFDRGAANDYAVRGLSDKTNYTGDANMVKLSSAPANGASVAFIVNAD